MQSDAKKASSNAHVAQSSALITHSKQMAHSVKAPTPISNSILLTSAIYHQQQTVRHATQPTNLKVQIRNTRVRNQLRL